MQFLLFLQSKTLILQLSEGQNFHLYNSMKRLDQLAEVGRYAVYSFCMIFFTQQVQSINPILIWVYPHKPGWPHLPHSNSYLFNPHSPPCSIQGILLLQNQHSCSTSPLASSTLLM